MPFFFEKSEKRKTNKELRKAAQNVDQYFQMFTGYQPQFRSLAGGIFEMDLTRACVDAIARNRAKFKPRISGSAYKNLERTLQFKPNPIQDTYNFLYKLSTITDVENNAFIFPIEDSLGSVVGFWPVRATSSEIKKEQGQLYLAANINGNMQAIEYAKVGHLRNHYYSSDFYGDSNQPFDGTLKLIDAQRQAIENGVASSSAIRFLAKIASMLQPDDITKERERFAKENLSNNGTGVLLFDNKYADVKQVDSKPFLVNAPQMQEIRHNAYEYFGVNEAILTNSYTEEQWNAFYEGKLEPWGLQTGLVITNMLFSDREKAMGNSVFFEANRLQYASNATKVNIVQTLFDRGFITTNQGLEVFNMPPVEGGDKRYIRKEYQEVSLLGKDAAVNVPTADPPASLPVLPGNKTGEDS